MKPKRENAVRMEIIEKATHLFRTYGYHAVSITDIQTASNTTRGNLYYHFPQGKDELAEYVIRNLGETSSRKLKQAFHPEKTPVENISHYFSSMVKEVDSRKDCNISLHLFLLETAEVSPRLKAICTETIKLLDSHFYAEIQRCGLSTEKTEQLALVVISMLLGAVNNCMLLDDSTELCHLIIQLPLIFAANGYVSDDLVDSLKSEKQTMKGMTVS